MKSKQFIAQLITILWILLLHIMPNSVTAVMKQEADSRFSKSTGISGITGKINTDSESWIIEIKDQPKAYEWQAFNYMNTGKIGLAFGSPIDLGLKSVKDEVLLSKSVEKFLELIRNDLGLENCHLETESVRHSLKNTIFLVRPTFDQIPVWGGYAVVTLNHKNAVMSLKAAGFGSIFEGGFKISSQQAQLIARNYIEEPVIEATFTHFWLPVNGQTGVVLKPCYEVQLSTVNPGLRPALFINAETGEILAAENRVHYVDLVGEIQGLYNPEYDREDAVEGLFPHEWIRIDGGAQTYSNEDGEFLFDVNQQVEQFNIRTELRGRWVNVDYDDGADGLIRFVVRQNERADVLWGEDDARLDERGLYYHTNYIHDHWKRLDPEFDGLDYPMPAVCQYGEEYNNAFWNGEGMYFGGGDGVTFGNFAMFSDIIYHEFGHGVTHHIYPRDLMPYEDEPGALNEAWSDYFPCSIHDDPFMGETQENGGGALRNLNNNLFYPVDIRNEVHLDSRLISAAMWHSREQLGREYSDQLFHFARYELGNRFISYFTDVLVTDDDNGDLTDGTPNYFVLFQQFGRHGIGPGVKPKLVETEFFIADDNLEGANGNNDRLWEAGETIRIRTTIRREGSMFPPPAQNVRLMVSCDNPDVEIIREVAGFGDMRVDDIRSIEEPLLFRVSENVEVGFANIILTYSSEEDPAIKIDTMMITVGVPELLVVADGDIGIGLLGQPIDWFYQFTFDTLGIIYTQYNTVSAALPLQSWSGKFKSILWYTGNARDNILSFENQEFLADFIDNGGNVLLTGQSIGENRDADDFVYDYFGAAPLADSVTARYVNGVIDDELVDGMRMIIVGDPGAWNQTRPSTIEAVEDAVEIFHFSDLDDQPACGVRKTYRDVSSKTIYCSFGIEAICGRPRNGYIEREDVIKRMLDWFNNADAVWDEGTSAVPLTISIGSAFPNPFNSMVQIPLRSNQRGVVSLWVYDVTGRQVWGGETSLQAGSNTIPIDANGWGTGIYVIRLQTTIGVHNQKLMLIR